MFLGNLSHLHALKGVGNRAFYRWLTKDYRALFPRLPERTCLFRLFRTHQMWLVTVLTRCGLAPPVYFLADEKHTHCLTATVYLPTIVSGRIIWHLGYTEAASAVAFTQSYRECKRTASQQEPSYRVRGVLTDGFDSTIKNLRTLFPGARLGNCLRHALHKLPGKLVAIASPVRKALSTQFHTLLYRARWRKGWRVFALSQQLRHFVDHITATAGAANSKRMRCWIQEKKAGWYAVFEDPRMLEDLADHLAMRDGRDDVQRPPLTPRAACHVQCKHPLEQPRPAPARQLGARLRLAFPRKCSDTDRRETRTGRQGKK
jgi:hypothetical protein